MKRSATRRNVQPTTATATPPFSKAVLELEVDFMILSTCFERSSELQAGAEEFSNISSAETQTDGSGRQRGADLRYDMQITLEEAASGCEKEIEIRKLDMCDVCEGSGAQKGSHAGTCSVCRGRGQVVASRGFFQVAQTCPNCQGTGRVIEKPCRSCHGDGRVERTSRVKLKIPAGIDEGARLRSAGGGEAGLRNGSPGDLYVVIHIKEHQIFQRDGMDLHCEMPIPFAIAALGGEVRVPTLGGAVNLKIPAGTQSDSVFRVRGQGLPSLHGSYAEIFSRSGSSGGADALEL